jgi:putative transposase
LTDARGVPLAVAVAGANRNDHKMARETLERIEVDRPKVSAQAPQNLCLDKGFDYPEVPALAREFSFTAHIRSRGEEARVLQRQARTKARRWVVERTHSWLNRFRGILIRWNKKAQNYIGMLHLALGLITLRASGLLG